ncbi:hypothetical protein B0T20DRAFT_12029 [Sordaria brevicollis]|uniref:Uncharacterized protein n=1 Tax=Sordaria brevicollis TaxID=83679 RepID=A0AAE0PNS8_SORBR|nr:hypothetical protein B0T20DRAFT_12029 [Sordaria brevicollis]
MAFASSISQWEVACILVLSGEAQLDRTSTKSPLLPQLQRAGHRSTAFLPVHLPTTVSYGKLPRDACHLAHEQNPVLKASRVALKGPHKVVSTPQLAFQVGTGLVADLLRPDTSMVLGGQ